MNTMKTFGIYLLSVSLLVTGCSEDEIFKTKTAPTPEITFLVTDEQGNESIRGMNAFEIPNPLLANPDASPADLQWTANVEVMIPAGTSIERVVVQYQYDLVFSNGGSAPQGWVDWDELDQESTELNGNAITYGFNADEINQAYWGGLPLLGSGMFNIVKDVNNVRFHVFLDNGLNQMSAKIIHWYPVVPGNAE